jgi:peroxiredoxin
MCIYAHAKTQPTEKGGFMQGLMPRKTVPSLRLDTLGGEVWDVDAQAHAGFTMLVFYRGYHCPVCQTYLRELARLRQQFSDSGISVFALSSDTRERAQLAHDKWGLAGLDIGYGLGIDKAREWGLYISASRGASSSGIAEPDVFSEPGIFVLKPDKTLYWASYSTMPFARPHFEEMLQAFDFVKKLDYPARGEL